MNKTKRKIQKQFEGHRVLIFKEDNTCTVEQVISFDSEILETDTAILPRENEMRLLDDNNGYVYHVFNLDKPARIEAENIKNLRRSSALKAMFDFDTGKKPFDLIGFMPWVIIALLAIFK
ncbi:hypothetical protein M3215_22805 [Bacillus cytotoxicus]|uniref:Uncharacterized protein n=1 Tax=Bacillus cytotoxicus TaxID=580165 RepID=A0ACC6AF33_9BACI|nr:hypothetical protein [Bacillus cytotoxicus]